MSAHTPGPLSAEEIDTQIARAALCDEATLPGDLLRSLLRMARAAAGLAAACEEAHELMAFHEGSAERMTPDGHPVVWVNDEDRARVQESCRAALASARLA